MGFVALSAGGVIAVAIAIVIANVDYAAPFDVICFYLLYLFFILWLLHQFVFAPLGLFLTQIEFEQKGGDYTKKSKYTYCSRAISVFALLGMLH